MQELSDSIVCISVIGPDKSPLYIAKSAPFKDSLEVEAMIFETLSFLERIPVKKAVRSSDRFVPRLHKNDKMVGWAYRASLNYLIIVLTPISLVFADADILKLLEKVKDAAFHAFTNPFYNEFAPITSNDFERKIFALSKSVVPQPIPQQNPQQQ